MQWTTHDIGWKKELRIDSGRRFERGVNGLAERARNEQAESDQHVFCFHKGGTVNEFVGLLRLRVRQQETMNLRDGLRIER
jgi:hypothetical protein